MAGIGNDKDGQPLEDNAQSNDAEGSQVDISVDTLVVNVFFDGTGNNMFNSELRLKTEDLTEEEKKLQKKLKGQVSFKNYYSNVALLYMGCSETESVKKIYIEGSGTFEHDKDSSAGLGFAMKGSGLHSRVTEAFEKIQELCEELTPAILQLNVYGFSRGAFYARYFCAMAKQDDKLIDSERNTSHTFSKTPQVTQSGRLNLKCLSTDIFINLVGIYDTVSSHGINHYNDVKPFQLNIGKQQGIKHIVHLTAQNDYRKHFPLTRINTAVSQANDELIAFECSLPGAHSDIGGAYTENYEEDQYLSVFEPGDPQYKPGEIYWLWYREMGYYQGQPTRQTTNKTNEQEHGQFKVRWRSVGHRDNPQHIYPVYAKRSVPHNNYQFISLEIMRDISQKAASLAFNGQGKARLNKDINSIAGYSLLDKFRKYAHQYVMERYHLSGLSKLDGIEGKFSVEASIVLSKAEEMELYQNFIHNSLDAADLLANGSDKRNLGPKRIIIEDNA